MSPRLRAVVSTTGYLAVLTALPAFADPVRLDTEAKAQAALVVPFYLTETVPQDIYFLVGGPQRYAQYALGLLAPVATYSIIASSPEGVTLACSYAGNLSAHATSGAPRVLHVDFNSCAFEVTGLVFDRTGPMDVTLFDSNLSPAAVAGIRVGSGETDLLERIYLASTPSSFSTSIRNLRVTGRIPVQRKDADWEFYGPLDYQTTGFYETSRSFTQPDGSVATTGQRFEAENLGVTGHRYETWLGNLQVFDLAFNFSGGILRSSYFDTAFNLSGTRTTTLGLTTTKWVNFNFGQDSYSSIDADGDVNIEWAPGNGAGCASGAYDIRTTEPWTTTKNIAYREISGGDTRFNGDVRVRFSSPQNPTIRLNVHGVGNFQYQEPLSWLTAALPCAW